ncbi:hypothetical protein J1N35_016742 [Gossypium stocksii]|uniref:RNase H type-1 domain-containing protein n=1 Tax=Gossypium stocksii TaxID=47602 RepID=A0A9D4A5G9_9ROSI|nr:hypothetical protein J1N35_016742 [Gossypium stocksii]
MVLARGNVTGAATTGCVVRNHEGVWILGIAKSIGTCSIVEAERWRVLEGLQQAWDIGARKVLLETDSLMVVSLLKSQQGMYGDNTLVRPLED